MNRRLPSDRSAARRPARLVALALLGLALALSVAAPRARAVVPTAEEEVQDRGVRALKSDWGSSPNWYDAAADDYRRIRLPPPPPPPAPPSNWTGFNFNFFAFFEGIGSILFWAAVLGVLLLIAAFLVWAYRARRKLLAGDADGVDVKLKQSIKFDRARVEALPFKLAGPRADDPLAEARSLYASGRYDQAIIQVYAYVLLELDRRQRIRLTRGKTNRQYLRELGRDPRLHALVLRLVETFEDSFFGGREIERSRFDVCWTSVDEILALSRVEVRS
jgi:hypothetical protein